MNKFLFVGYIMYANLLQMAIDLLLSQIFIVIQRIRHLACQWIKNHVSTVQWTWLSTLNWHNAKVIHLHALGFSDIRRKVKLV